MSTLLRHMGIGLVVLVAVTCEDRGPANRQPLRPLHIQKITAAQVKRSSQFQGFKAEGNLYIPKEVTLTTPIEGLVKTFIDTAQTVEKDQVLLTLSATELELATSAKRNALRLLQEKLEQGRSEPIEEAAPANTAEEDSEGSKAEEAKAQHDEQTDEQREARWEEIQVLLEAESAKVESEIALLEHQLTQGRITAPFTGYLTPLVSFYANQPVKANDPLYRLQAFEAMRIRFSVPLEFAPYVDTDMPLAFIPYATPELVYNGSVQSLSAQVDNSTFFEAVGSVPNSDRILKDGQKGEVQVKTHKKRELLTLPRAALVYRPQTTAEPQVFLITDKKVYLQKVKLGQIYDDEIEVIDGVNEGDWVATSDLEFLIDGDQVESETTEK